MRIHLHRIVIHITLPYLSFPDVLSVDYSAVSLRTICFVYRWHLCSYSFKNKVGFPTRCLRKKAKVLGHYFVTMLRSAHFAGYSETSLVMHCFGERINLKTAETARVVHTISVYRYLIQNTRRCSKRPHKRITSILWQFRIKYYILYASNMLKSLSLF